jgi:hypothetical protein
MLEGDSFGIPFIYGEYEMMEDEKTILNLCG